MVDEKEGRGRVLGPSDLGLYTESELLLGGRIVDVADLDLVTVADAFASVPVRGAALVGLLAGDLVVLRVKKDESGLTCDEVVETHGPDRPDRASEGEAARLMRRGVGANLVARALALGTIRSFFAERRFLEVDTPALVPSPGLDLHLDAVMADGGWLITSPEYQMKRLLVGGVPRAYQISHVYRKGEIGSRHNPEFSMLEWYRAFATMAEVMADTEELVTLVVRALTGGTEIACANANVNVAAPFERLAVADAFTRYAGVAANDALALAETDEEAFFRLLVDVVEPALSLVDHPVFLTDYPISQASLARPNPHDARVAERFELYVGGVELCNGFGELTDAREQRVRFARDQAARRAAGKPVYPVDERFVAALEEGMPPSAGNALGIDRLVYLAAESASIGDVMAFPADWL